MRQSWSAMVSMHLWTTLCMGHKVVQYIIALTARSSLCPACRDHPGVQRFRPLPNGPAGWLLFHSQQNLGGHLDVHKISCQSAHGVLSMLSVSSQEELAQINDNAGG